MNYISVAFSIRSYSKCDETGFSGLGNILGDVAGVFCLFVCFLSGAVSERSWLVYDQYTFMAASICR